MLPLINCNKVGSLKSSNFVEMKADRKRLYNDVEILTQLDPPRHSDNISSLNKAAEYIKKEFEKAGLNTEEQKWLAGAMEYKNVIASYNTDKSKRLIVGAHYDVCGDQPGADDNASGIAGLLETARLVASGKPKLDYRIDFVAYNLEEPPFFASQKMGSYIHARYLKENKVPVIGMLCFEMIGYFSDEPNSQEFPSKELKAIYPNTGNFIVVVGLEKQRDFSKKVHNLMKADASINVELINFPAALGIASLSDHRNYWVFGFPAVMINDTAFLRNPNYHQKSDKIETLDFEKITAVVNASYQAVIRME
jgi:Zn-dependent M28 family amino/carboxypeptidase